MIMHEFLPSKNFALFISLITILNSVSCVTQKKVEYLQSGNDNVTSFKEADLPDYRLKADDELFIQINSLDESAANVFTTTAQQTFYTGSIDPFGASLLSYSVDKNGYVFMPVVGHILVKDKTLSDVTLLLKDSLDHVLNHPTISVKLVNRYVSVLGEVANPGHFPVSQNKFTVLDAIGLAGDITDYGNRNEVVLIRNENGENLRINVDLTRSDLLSSQYYSLKPNDIVYVKPLSKKFWGMRQFPFGVVFSALTTGLLIYDFIR
jgi:polysaccharide export outer membrane protein